MSKFKFAHVSGGNNQFGDGTTQNNIVNNTNNNQKFIGVNNSDENGVHPLLVFGAATVALAIAIWLFYNHIDQIYNILNIALLTAPALSAVGFLVLLSKEQAAKEDFYKLLLLVIGSIAVYYLSFFSRLSAPVDLIQYSQSVNHHQFIQSIMDIDIHSAMSNIVSVFFITASCLLLHLASFRYLSYSLSHTSATGFWYNLYCALGLFTSKRVFFLLLSFISFSMIALNHEYIVVFFNNI